MATKTGRYYNLYYNVTANDAGLQKILANLIKGLTAAGYKPSRTPEGNVVTFGSEGIQGRIQANEIKDGQWVVAISCTGKLITERIYAQLEKELKSKRRR